MSGRSPSILQELCDNSSLQIRPYKGIADTHLENLNASRVIGSQDGRGQVVAFSCQRQCRCGYNKGQLSKSSDRNSMIHADL